MDNKGYILKFGKLEHLHSLGAGKVFFNTISKYRDDETAYRGDNSEGKIPLAPQSVYFYDENGNYLFGKKIPMPDSIEIGLNNDDNLHMFCAVLLDICILDKTNSDSFVIKSSVRNEMMQFGDYVAVINIDEFEAKLRRIMDNKEQGLNAFIFDKIKYIDKANLTNIPKEKIDYYYIKDIKYKNQNEWRLIIFGNFDENDDHSVTLDLLPFTDFHICKASDFLEKYKATGD